MSASTPQIAALITYHNEGARLARCVQSMLAQVPPLAEILIHDDASTVRPEAFVPADPRIRIVRSETNIGPARGRNRLLAESRSRFLHWHDADDWLLPGWNAQVEAAFAAGAELVYCQMRAVDSDGALLTDNVLRLDALRTAADPVPVAMRYSLMVSSMALDRALLERSGPWPEQYEQSEDYAFNLMLLLQRPRLAVIGQPLVMVDWGTHNRSNDVARVYADSFRVVDAMAAAYPQYRAEGAEVVAEQAAVSWRKGHPDVAVQGFALAHRLGPPRFCHFPAWYRRLAAWLGQSAVERLTAWYRRFFPENWRARMQRWRHR